MVVPDIRLEAPQVRVDVPVQPAPIVNVTVPERQRVDIVSLPRLNAKVRRDRNGLVSGIEED